MIEVSFIVPCFNAQRTIRQCIDSLLSQDLASGTFEVIVVDNNSRDHSLEIVKSYSGVMSIEESQQGRSFARNRGARAARGRLLAFIDADVYLEPSWASSLIKLFDDEEVIASQGQIVPCLNHGSPSLNRYRRASTCECTEGTYILTTMKKYEFPMINSAACMYRQSTFMDMGGFDIYLERHEDIDLSRRAFFSGGTLACHSDAVAHVIFHGESWLDYLKRCFDDGYYKNAYMQKWKYYQAPLSGQKKSKKVDFFKWCFSLLLKMPSRNFLYYMLSLIMGTLNAWGRSWGRLFHRGYYADHPFSLEVKNGRVVIDGAVVSDS